MAKKLRTASTPRFGVIRAVESFVFGLPVCIAFFYDVWVFFTTLAVCLVLFAAWEKWLKRRLTVEDAQAYDDVHMDEQDKRLGFQRIRKNIRWSIWLMWAAVLFGTIASLMIFG